MSDTDYQARLKTGRNDKCPCGSGKKYKKCHLAEDEASRTTALKALEEEAQARAAAKAEEEGEEEGEDGKVTAKGKRKGANRRGGSGAKTKASEGKTQAMRRRGIA